MTINYEKIKAMSIEEMAKYFQTVFDPNKDNFGCLTCTDYGTHHYPNDCIGSECRWLTIGGDIKKWLQQEAE